MESKYQSHFHCALHSVQKNPLKPWKKPIAPLPPVPPKVYKVDPENFKKVVQDLTAEPEFRQSRLRNLAPPPLSLSTPQSDHAAKNAATKTTTTLELLIPSPKTETPTWSNIYRELMCNEATEMEQPRRQKMDSLVAFSPLGLGLSPTSYAWCSLPLLSPGTLSSLDQGTVLI